MSRRRGMIFVLGSWPRMFASLVLRGQDDDAVFSFPPLGLRRPFRCLPIASTRWNAEGKVELETRPALSRRPAQQQCRVVAGDRERFHGSPRVIGIRGIVPWIGHCMTFGQKLRSAKPASISQRRNRIRFSSTRTSPRWSLPLAIPPLATQSRSIGPVSGWGLTTTSFVRDARGAGISAAPRVPADNARCPAAHRSAKRSEPEFSKTGVAPPGVGISLKRLFFRRGL